MDIDQLSTEVLWKLDRYANAVLQSIRRKAGQKPPEGQTAATADAANGKDLATPNGGSGSVAAADPSSNSSSSGVL